jgi:hypothetical protein
MHFMCDVGGMLIESYDFGRIVIDGVVYTEDVIIIGDKVESNWWRNDGHALQVSDLQEALAKFTPQIVIVGTGFFGMMQVTRETREHFEAKGIEFLTERTKKACELFNSVSKSKRTLAGLHLTC